jgi:hypothetical protein
LPRLWEFTQGDLWGILKQGFFFKKILLGFPRILEKYNMPCHEMHPM